MPDASDETEYGYHSSTFFTRNVGEQDTFLLAGGVSLERAGSGELVFHEVG